MGASDQLQPSMNASEQLQHEARLRTRYAALAVVAGVLIVAQAAIQLSGPHTRVDELTLDLLTAHRRFPIDLIGAVVDAFALIALAGTLQWLHQISRARNLTYKDLVRWVAIVGALLSGVMAVAYAVVIAVKANQFATTGQQTYLEASHLTTSGLVVVLPLLAQLGSLLLTVGFIWIAINSMRVGLLTRFMGYLGVLAGALVLFPIGSPVPIVQGFWLLGLAVLFAGRWPAGTPEAWRTGVAVPWAPLGQPREPAARAQRGQRGQRAPAPARPARPARGGARAALMKSIGAPAVADPPVEAEAAAASSAGEGGAPRTRANTPKRKRKKRGSR